MVLDASRAKRVAAVVRSGPLGQTRKVTKLFLVRAGWIAKQQSWLSAVEDVSLSVHRGETLGLVGESGSGKSTLARLLVHLIEPTHGEVRYNGRNIFGLSGGERRRFRRQAQIVFQDPYSSLNPRHTVETIVGEGIQGLDRRQKANRRTGLRALLGHAAETPERYPA